VSTPVETLRRKMVLFTLSVFSLQEENRIVRKGGLVRALADGKWGAVKQLS
jgi:hypothetical protein